MFTPRSAARRIERPRYVWIAVAAEAFTAIGAIPVGVALLADTSGQSVGLPPGRIEATPFGSYLVPALYLLAVNGAGMLAAAALSVQRHPWAPSLTGILGSGLVVWIAVQLAVLPDRSSLQALFGGIGLGLVLVSVAWLGRTGQIRLR